MSASHWHLVTGEFPPALGGVSDYSLQIAAGLAAAGERVHVWCPDAGGDRPDARSIEVHRIAGAWRGSDLTRIDLALDRTPAGRRLLVQWVPHAYGRRSLNIGFCRWVRRRASRGDTIDLMVHEPFLSFGEGGWRHNGAAAVHRLMAAMLLGVTRRAWVAIPAWATALRPWVLGRRPPFCWLPVPSNIPVRADAAAVAALRERLAGGHALFGHFGTYGRDTCAALTRILAQLLPRAPESRVLLLGLGGDAFADQLRRDLGPPASRVHATGALDLEALSLHLQACRVLVQPYTDGASTRRGTLMAALAHGIPVATTYGRLSEPFWRDSEAVTAVPAGDDAGIVEAAVTLAVDPVRTDRQARAARQLYEARFDVRHAIQALLSDACTTA